jgi:hypothetical protein
MSFAWARGGIFYHPYYSLEEEKQNQQQVIIIIMVAIGTGGLQQAACSL